MYNNYMHFLTHLFLTLKMDDESLLPPPKPTVFATQSLEKIGYNIYVILIRNTYMDILEVSVFSMVRKWACSHAGT